MRKFTLFFLGLAIGVGALALAACGDGGSAEDEALFISEFAVAKEDLVSSGRNPYFVLEPNHALVLKGGGEELVITVLNETKMVDGVETRVVEERSSKKGKLDEVARNYFAINKRTNDVYYFGEDVDFYKDGKVVSHEGSWLSGVDGAKFGLMMPGQPSPDLRFYQERAPDAKDRAKIVGLIATVKTPAGEFKDCLKVEETNPLEDNAREFKYYAPGVGLVQSESMKLVKLNGRAP